MAPLDEHLALRIITISHSMGRIRSRKKTIINAEVVEKTPVQKTILTGILVMNPKRNEVITNGMIQTMDIEVIKVIIEIIINMIIIITQLIISRSQILMIHLEIKGETTVGIIIKFNKENLTRLKKRKTEA